MRRIAKMFFSIALLAIALAGLVGCASETFHRIDQPIIVGDRVYTALLAKDRDPWGGNVSTIMIAESEHNGGRSVTIEEPRRRPEPSPCFLVRREPIPVQRVTVELTNTHVVNCNNQGSIGWANNAFQGVVGDAIIGGSMMGAARLLRPTHIAGGSSSAAAASAAAASGP